MEKRFRNTLIIIIITVRDSHLPLFGRFSGLQYSAVKHGLEDITGAKRSMTDTARIKGFLL